MISQDLYSVGDLVALTRDNWRGIKAIVSVPIEPGRTGHVLILADGCIQGVDVSFQDLTPLDQTSEGYVQLARKLIDLGSHVIEKKLIDLI